MKQLFTVVVLVVLAFAVSGCSFLDPCNSPKRWIFQYSHWTETHEIELGQTLVLDLRDRFEIVTTSGNTSRDVLKKEPLIFDSLAVDDPTVADMRVVHGTDLSITGLKVDTTTYVVHLSGDDLYDTAGADRYVCVELHGTVIVRLVGSQNLERSQEKCIVAEALSNRTETSRSIDEMDVSPTKRGLYEFLFERMLDARESDHARCVDRSCRA